MNKSLVLETIIARLRSDLDAVKRAISQAKEGATHAESKAVSKYDTFGLEASYLAHGQAKRALEVEGVLGHYQRLQLRSFDEDTPIALTALVLLETEDGQRTRIFIGPGAGGLKVAVEGTPVVVVTPQAPLGESLLGKLEGDDTVVFIGGKHRQVEIVDVR